MDGLSLKTGADGFMKAVDFWDRREERKQMMGLRDAQAKRSDEAFEMEKENHHMNKQLHESNQEWDRLKKAQALAQNQELLLGIAAKEAYALESSNPGVKYSNEELEALSFFPNLKADYLMSDQVGSAIQNAQQVIQGNLDINSPEALEAINTLFPEVQAGASDGRKRKVVSAAPGKQPETLVFGLAVEGESAIKPLTKARSSDQKDPVKQIRIDDMVQKVVKTQKMRELMKSPEGRRYLITRAGMSGKAQDRYSNVYKDEASGAYGQRNLSTNEFKQLKANGAGLAGSSGGAGGLTQRQKDYYFARDVLRYEEDEALEFAGSDSTPSERAHDYARRMVDIMREENMGTDFNAQEAYQGLVKDFMRKYFKGNQKQNNIPDADSFLDSLGIPSAQRTQEAPQRASEPYEGNAISRFGRPADMIANAVESSFDEHLVSSR